MWKQRSQFLSCVSQNVIATCSCSADHIGLLREAVGNWGENDIEECESSSFLPRCLAFVFPTSRLQASSRSQTCHCPVKVSYGSSAVSEMTETLFCFRALMAHKPDAQLNTRSDRKPNYVAITHDSETSHLPAHCWAFPLGCPYCGCHKCRVYHLGRPRLWRPWMHRKFDYQDAQHRQTGVRKLWIERLSRCSHLLSHAVLATNGSLDESDWSLAHHHGPFDVA